MFAFHSAYLRPLMAPPLRILLVSRLEIAVAPAAKIAPKRRPLLVLVLVRMRLLLVTVVKTETRSAAATELFAAIVLPPLSRIVVIVSMLLLLLLARPAALIWLLLLVVAVVMVLLPVVRSPIVRLCVGASTSGAATAKGYIIVARHS